MPTWTDPSEPPPPEHNRGTAKHIGTSWICHWNICSLPSLPVNCCVQSGPGTASLSASLSSAAGGRSLRGPAWPGLPGSAAKRGRAGPGPHGGGSDALGPRGAPGSRAALGFLGRAWLPGCPWLAALPAGEGWAAACGLAGRGAMLPKPGCSSSSPRSPGEERSRAPHFERSPQGSAALQASPAWKSRLLFTCVLWCPFVLCLN